MQALLLRSSFAEAKACSQYAHSMACQIGYIHTRVMILKQWLRQVAVLKGHGRAGEFKAELILKNFHTLMGRRVGRMFASLFAQDPHFKGRQVATLHNQRDYIFFRLYLHPNLPKYA